MAERPYIVGNWKMNGTRAMLSEARAIDRAAQRYMKVEVALAPPFTLLHAVHREAELRRTVRREVEDRRTLDDGVMCAATSPAKLAPERSLGAPPAARSAAQTHWGLRTPSFGGSAAKLRGSEARPYGGQQQPAQAGPCVRVAPAALPR